MHFTRNHSATTNSNRRLQLGATAVAFAVLAWSANASAYCRTSVCDRSVAGELCTPSQTGDCGTPLFWKGGCFGFSVNEAGSRQVDVDTVEGLMRTAFDSWSNAACPGGTPSIEAVNLGRVACSAQEYNDKTGNANIIVFRDNQWPYAGQGNTLALTTVTYNLDTGEIFDVDLEVNGTDELAITTADTGVQYDLLSILAHEAGHMLGLSHSDVPDATMKVEYIPGDISLRQLAQDDVDGICAAYPPGQSGTCDPEPRRGLQTECGNTEPDDGCSAATPGARQPTSAPAHWAYALALLLMVRRRRT
jgi:hypothetical protein